MIDRQTNIRLAIVVAMARNGVIGDQGELPWALPDDMKWFREVTMGKPVVMGRVTFESIGKPLPGRDNIVVTRNAEFAETGITAAPDLEDAIAIAEAFAVAREVNEIAIIGGAQIYEQALPHVTRLYLTEVDADIDGDTHFPSFDRSGWTETPVREIPADGRHDHAARIVTLDRAL